VPPRVGGDRGFALLIVLWSVVLLALLVTQLVAAGRTELQLAANLRGAAVAEAAADGALHEAIFHLLDPATRWRADGVPHVLQRPSGTATVRIEDEGGKVNPNTAPPELLSALLRRAGADARTAGEIALAIVAWRFPNRQGPPAEAAYRAAGKDYGPPGAPFRSVAEVGAVLGMTPALMDLLQQGLSVHTDTDPVAAVAPPIVRQALIDMRGPAPPGPAPPGPAPAPRTVAVTALMEGEGGRFTRRAVVRLGMSEKEPPFQILTWDVP